MTPEEHLETELATPTAALVSDLSAIDGDLVVLGASGKMGPSLVALQARADVAAGRSRRIIAVARFSSTTTRLPPGVERVAADLLDPKQVQALPDAPNVIYLVGQKFGTVDDPARTWAVNAAIPAFVAEKYRDARLVVFSTGNVYPLMNPATGGPTETSPTAPMGDYAQSALAREQVFRFYANRHGTAVAILRINYAIEPRYGVLRDIGDRVFAGQPVDLTTGWVNVIWQRDANAIAIRALRHATSPPLLVNVTGPIRSVRAIAEGFGRRLGKGVSYTGQEAPTALISNPGRCLDLFGPLEVELDEMIDRVARWIEIGGRSLGKPTHFAEREGRF